MKTSTAYGGPRRKLVLAFDLGTTYSGISYSILDPGQVPEIKPVTRFPAHEHITGASKISTIIYYDRKGTVRAVGAEAKDENVFEKAEEEHWVKAEWFKLHLKQKTANEDRNLQNIPPLPLNKTVTEVIADFLAYLLQCASSYIQDSHPDGASLWASFRNEIHFVLSHPNGWEGKQQAEMRKAAVLAKLIPPTPSGHSRLSFVTEGEASLHFSIYNGLPDGAMKRGDGVVIVDAGGGTIDISSYSKKIGCAPPKPTQSQKQWTSESARQTYGSLEKEVEELSRKQPESLARSKEIQDRLKAIREELRDPECSKTSILAKNLNDEKKLLEKEAKEGVAMRKTWQERSSKLKESMTELKKDVLNAVRVHNPRSSATPHSSSPTRSDPARLLVPISPPVSNYYDDDDLDAANDEEWQFDSDDGAPEVAAFVEPPVNKPLALEIHEPEHFQHPESENWDYDYDNWDVEPALDDAGMEA
ncbi:hypothetical protein D9613_001115 [Agrocybe pediades]|uniref:Uncharacterized protein n=1 Tax=Agrocybe pediades TaxID=84607 RepID=A0A8H4R267_9AGAR|nr:hypothetical protein D9613_001115 [Agrocybe pediades]